jgi:DNA polymerase elongation subunit (family B)
MVVFDIETAPISDAATYLERATAPSNYKDEAKIAAYIEDATKQAVAKAALDVDLCRVVALGTWFQGIPDSPLPNVVTCANEDEERFVLDWFWRSHQGHAFCGYNILDFDLPVLLRRSLYLGVDVPRLELGRYKHPRVMDLMQILSYDGKLKFRSLSFYCKRFGIPDTDTMCGADIGAAIERGDWDAVRSHCESDVAKTVALAQRLGVLCTEETVF